MKSKGKPFHFCFIIKNRVSNNFVKILFKINNLSLS